MTSMREQVAAAIASPSTRQVTRLAAIAKFATVGPPQPAAAMAWMVAQDIDVRAYESATYTGFMAYTGSSPDVAIATGYGQAPYDAVCDLVEAGFQVGLSAMQQISARDANVSWVASKLAERNYQVAEKDVAVKWDHYQWLNHLLGWPGNLRIDRVGATWCATIGPDATIGLAGYGLTREDATIAFHERLKTAVIYKNGQQARPGDVIMCQPGGCPHPVSAVVVRIQQGNVHGADLFVSTAWPMQLAAGATAINLSRPAIPVEDEAWFRPYKATQGTDDGLALVAICTWFVHAPAAPVDAPFVIKLECAWARAIESSPLHSIDTEPRNYKFPPYDPIMGDDVAAAVAARPLQ